MEKWTTGVDNNNNSDNDFDYYKVSEFDLNGDGVLDGAEFRRRGVLLSLLSLSLSIYIYIYIHTYIYYTRRGAAYKTGSAS